MIKQSMPDDKKRGAPVEENELKFSKQMEDSSPFKKLKAAAQKLGEQVSEMTEKLENVSVKQNTQSVTLEGVKKSLAAQSKSFENFKETQGTVSTDIRDLCRKVCQDKNSCQPRLIAM